MKAVILAAGEGVRCRPLTQTRSKVMLSVANKPILEHIIYSLAQNNITDIILVVSYEKEKIMDYFEDGLKFGVNITYVEQKSHLGTAHAVKQARELVEPDGTDFLVLNGDNIIGPKTISDLINGHTGDATVLTVKMQDTSRYGVVIAEGNKVKRIVEKPRTQISNLVNTGIYVFKPQIFETIESTPISEGGEYAITDTIQLMIDSGMEISMVNTKSKWLDAIYVWDLLRANSIALDEHDKYEIKGKVEEGAHIKGNVAVGQNTIIRSGCYIVGPVVIGNNCDIGPNVVILPSTAIGNNVSIGSFTKIQNSIVMHDGRIGAHGYISNSVIGSNNSIGPYFITEEKDDLKIEIEGTLQKAEKLGTITGDDTTIGHNVLVKAGAMIATNCSIESGNVIPKTLPRDSIVI